MARGVGFKYAVTRGGLEEMGRGVGRVHSKRRKSQRKSSNCVPHYPEECRCVPLLLFFNSTWFPPICFFFTWVKPKTLWWRQRLPWHFLHFLQPRNSDFSRGHFKCLPPTRTSIILPCVRILLCVCVCGYTYICYPLLLYLPRASTAHQPHRCQNGCGGQRAGPPLE